MLISVNTTEKSLAYKLPNLLQLQRVIISQGIKILESRTRTHLCSAWLRWQESTVGNVFKQIWAAVILRKPEFQAKESEQKKENNNMREYVK